MNTESSSARALRVVERTIGRAGRAPAAWRENTPSPVLERLEERTFLSGGGEDDVAVLRAWWAVSGSSHLTVKLAQDAARAARPSARPATTRGAYDRQPVPNDSARAAGARPVETQVTATVSAAPAAPLAATAAPLMPVMPSSDEWYSAIVNANQYIVNYEQNVPSKLKLITDLVGTSPDTWAQAVVRTQAMHPHALIGTYHSFRDAQYAGTTTYYPRRAVPREGLSDSQILMTDPSGQVHVVDYSQPEARQYLVKHVVQDVTNTGRPLAFLDNVSHDESGFPIPWTTTMSVLGEMTTNLHNLGKRVIVNAAWIPGVTSTDSVDQFIATGVDGVSLEMGFHRNVRNDAARINTAMQQYRRMLDAGQTVILIASGGETGDAPTVENREIEQRLQAAFGMMFREPGDRLFVSQLFWRPVLEWTEWPQRFGPALGAATVSTNAAGEVVMSRRFANYTLTLNTATKEVTYA